MADRAPSHVLAILVTHDGEEWLDRSLGALAAQTYPHLDVVAVDNGSTDGSRKKLLEHLPEERVLVAERDLGFGAAVSMALDAAVSASPDLLWLVHDDLELEPDALERLVVAVQRDDSLAIVGPKLVEWDDPRRLQSVGMAIDITGRASSDLETDELDQGQRDQVHRALYVSTAGMLVRRAVFDELGRFDRRYHLFRDDLDLCWRAWLLGHDVELIPGAVGTHLGAAANYHRLGQTAFLGPRYFAERNTLATLIKNYGGARLAWILPLFLVVGVAKVAGFVATRRLGDAWQTVRAWVWNVLHLRRTWRLRRQVQSRRERTDAELRALFAKVAPRLRAYGEAMADWVAGGEPDFDEPPVTYAAEPATATERLVGYARRRPVTLTAALLAIVAVIGAVPVLQPGSLRGGELAPWPADATAFLRTYLSSWHDVGGYGTGVAPSPAQAILGLLSLMTLGSEYLASRAVVLLALPIAWLLALRAARIVTVRRVPRLAAATVYVLSPPALSAVATGSIGALVVVAGLPGLVAAGATMVDPRAGSASAWRATAAAALVGATMVAFVPATLLAVLAAVVVALGVSTGTDASAAERRAIVTRMSVAAAGILLLLLPWTVALFRPPSPVFEGFSPALAVDQPFWRWLLLSPDAVGYPGLLAGVGAVVAGVLGLVFGFPRRPILVAAAWTVALGGVYTAWALGRAGPTAWVSPTVPLLVSAAAFAGLLAVAFASAGAQLGQHAFGWRQVASVGTTAVVAVSLAASSWFVLGGPWEAYAVGEGPLPAFIASEQEAVGDFRVLVLAEEDGAIRWDVTGPAGPTMLRYGVPMPQPLEELIGGAVRDLAGRVDPGAAGRLGLANVRYVFVPEGAAGSGLVQALEDQLDLEPQPMAAGRVYRVASWLPRVAFVPEEPAADIARRGEVPPANQAVPFSPSDPTLYRGEALRSGAVLVAESAANGWEATADGESLTSRSAFGLMRFDVEGAAERITVSHDRQATRTALVVLQGFFVLVAISLILRPPGSTQVKRQ